MSAVIEPTESVESPPVTVPSVGSLPPIRIPAVADVILSNGLRVVAARRPGVPRFEIRLHIPTARGGTAAEPARRFVLSKALLGGTARRSSTEIAEALQAMGASLDTTANSEECVLIGSALAGELVRFLELVGEVVATASFPGDEVALQRERAAQEVRLTKSQPATIAQEAFQARLFGRHPYGRPLPSPEAVARAGAGALRTMHKERILPAGSVLVIVGDVTPTRAVDAATRAFAGWRGRRAKAGLPPAEIRTDQPTLIVDRKGSVQTSIRIGGPAVDRKDPVHPALTVANLVFGGYFAARLSDNIREKRGYTYGAYSLLQNRPAASHFMITTDVGTDVTAPALVETRYELGRMVAEPPPDEELVAAKRYLAGTLAMGLGTQNGLAAFLSMLTTNRLPIEYLRDYPKRIERVTAKEAHAAAVRFLAPKNLATVLVGEGSAIRGGIEALDEVEVRAHEEE